MKNNVYRQVNQILIVKLFQVSIDPRFEAYLIFIFISFVHFSLFTEASVVTPVLCLNIHI